ncbi:MAG: CehA/McbA family metallohydrolase, partial [Planctomycetota bacterium]
MRLAWFLRFVFALSLSAPAFAQSVDGSFESGAAGWTLDGTRVVAVGSAAYHGTSVLEFDPGTRADKLFGGASATFATTPGQEYRVVYAYQAGFARGLASLALTLNGTTPHNVADMQPFFDPGVDRDVPLRSAWLENSIGFFATRSTTTVRLGPLSRWNPAHGWGRVWIDHVRLEPLGRSRQLGRDFVAHVTAPSIVTSGEEVELTVTFTGRPRTSHSGQLFDTRPVEFSGSMGLSCSDLAAEFPPALTSALQNSLKVKVRARTPGVQRFLLAHGPYRAYSNPLFVTESPARERAYWGDLHIHTKDGHSDWVGGTPAENYAAARGLSDLDFAALSEHYYSNAATWMDEHVPATAAAYEPGKFVTFLATETSTHQGHTNWYLRGSDPFDMFDGRSSLFGSRDVMSDTLRTLGGRFLAIPHHFSLLDPVDWRETDSEVLRLAEVYSCHGSSEEAGRWWRFPDHISNDYSDTRGARGHDLLTGLARGHKLGVIASSDSHALIPGFAGMTCVRTGALTREGVWDALYRRDCYATTGERILMEFSIGGARMGRELRLAAGAALVAQARVYGTDVIEALELVRDGNVVASLAPNAFDAVHSFPLASFSGASGWVYLRVRQRNGHRAWSSPIFLEPLGAPELTLERRDVRFDHAAGQLQVTAHNTGDRPVAATLKVWSSEDDPALAREARLAALTQPTVFVRVEPSDGRHALVRILFYTPTLHTRAFTYSGTVHLNGAASYRVLFDPRRMLVDDSAGTLTWSSAFGYHYRLQESKAGQTSSFELLVETNALTTLELAPRIDGGPVPMVFLGTTAFPSPVQVDVPLGSSARLPARFEVPVLLRPFSMMVLEFAGQKSG